MKNQMVIRIILGLSIVAAAACGSSDDGGGSGQGTVTAEIQVLEFLPTTPFPPLTGFEVCVYDGDECAITDADGRARLELPANAETGVTLRREGYVPGITPYTTGDTDLSVATLATSESLIQTLATVLSSEWPMDGTGVVSVGTIGADPFVFGENGIAGVTISGSDAGRQYYFDGSVPSTAINATTDSLGSGGYVEIPPGDYEVTLGGTATNCRPYGAWVSDGSNAFAFPVLDGYITYAFVMCDPAP